MRKISSNRVHLRFDNKNDIDPNESLLFLFFLHNILPRDITLFVYYIPEMRRCFLNCHILCTLPCLPSRIFELHRRIDRRLIDRNGFKFITCFKYIYIYFFISRHHFPRFININIKQVARIREFQISIWTFIFFLWSLHNPEIEPLLNTKVNGDSPAIRSAELVLKIFSILNNHLPSTLRTTIQ